ncbi:MAG: cytochrome b N-terminal domain-containing protein, partial [Deltaproteobacteria bacterium]|nr:cytochrome b N-terminal domain-containing protein [Deltaproteobacteria bacterium]
MPDQGAILKKRTLFQRVRHSIFPGQLQPVKDREGYRRFFNTLILHFRPRTVPERTLELTLTWGLGGMAVVLVLMLMGTGVLLKFVYEPLPEKAYESILYLQRDVLFGSLIRNIHHWSGKLLLIIVFLHFLRVFFTGAFHPPRQFNWIIGLGLFCTVLFSNFTGYLLPWDGLATLSNFYAIHTAILPGIIILLMPFHFWRVRKARGLVIPRAPEDEVTTRGKSVNTIPNLIIREVVVALVLMAFILVLSTLFNAPLEGKANPGLSPNPTKAPWYFSGIQEMLMHFHPFFSLFIIPVLILIALISLPYIDDESSTAGV